MASFFMVIMTMLITMGFFFFTVSKKYKHIIIQKNNCTDTQRHLVSGDLQKSQLDNGQLI